MPRFRNLVPDDPRTAACRRAVAIGGGAEKFGPMLGITPQAICYWKVVPPERCREVERLTGVSRYDLRPDIYGTAAEALASAPMMEAHFSVGSKALAEALSITVAEMHAWDEIPAELVRKIERLSGVSRYRLRPDVFGEGPEEKAA